MFCPNCGSSNAKRQRFCRYCGLQIDKIGAKLASQLALGRESDDFRRLRSLRRFIDGAQISFITAALIGLVTMIFFDWAIGKTFLGIGMLALLLTETLRAFTRHSMAESRSGSSNVAEQSKLLEEKHFEPASMVTEDKTELFKVGVDKE